MTGHGDSEPELIGPLLRRRRKSRGWSQVQLADKLCHVAGRATVTRHEVSRWERGERVPTVWLYALAVVLETPLEELEAAGHAARERLPRAGVRPPGQPWLWRPPVALDLLAALDHRALDDLPDLAHAWLAGPPGGQDPEAAAAGAPAPEPVLLDGSGRDLLGLWEARLGRLRRADDLLGGVELAGAVDRRLREVIPLLKRIGNPGGRLRNRALRLIAGYAQLAGWVHADAGNQPAARCAYRVGLKAASAAGDRALAAHVLGSLSSLILDIGRAHDALLLARTGLAGLATAGPPSGGRSDPHLLRALLLHRAALAAAKLRERRDAETALAEAERVADRSEPGQVPEWLSWLDAGELAAMTGRCLAVAGRPLRAVRLLARPSRGGGPRGSAMYGCWLARAYATLGEREEARRAMHHARLQVARAGSARAEAALRHAEARLGARHGRIAPNQG